MSNNCHRTKIVNNLLEIGLFHKYCQLRFQLWVRAKVSSSSTIAMSSESLSAKRMRLSLDTSSALSDPVETTTTIASAASSGSNSSSLLKMPLALLIKLTNYFLVCDFFNYTRVCQRFSTIVGRLESVEARHSQYTILGETKFAMTHSLPKQLEISLAAAFEPFYANLVAMTSLEKLLLLSQLFQDTDNSMIRAKLLKLLRDSETALPHCDNNEQKQSQQLGLQSQMRLPSFPKLRSLAMENCLGYTQLFDLFNLNH